MEKEKIQEYINNTSYFILFFLILISIPLISYEKNCKQDQECFINAIKTCTPARVILEKENSIYLYSIEGPKKNYCIINIKLEKAVGLEEEKQQLEGKDMNCKLTKENILEKDLLNTKEYLSECSGPLKEGIYELIISKLYGTISQNFGDILHEIRETMPE